jgi:hypothetical protein
MPLGATPVWPWGLSKKPTPQQLAKRKSILEGQPAHLSCGHLPRVQMSALDGALKAASGCPPATS